eukprot:1160124-Pelagomonas_calceolata.AAC.2
MHPVGVLPIHTSFLINPVQQNRMLVSTKEGKHILAPSCPITDVEFIRMQRHSHGPAPAQGCPSPCTPVHVHRAIKTQR